MGLTNFIDPESVVTQFDISGRLRGIEPVHMGHIHDSFISKWSDDTGENRYLHQRMNHTVFPDLEGLMNNILLVTEHLASHPIEGEETLSLIASKREGVMVQDRNDNFWRTFKYVENAEVINRCPSPMHAYEAGRIFGSFIQRLTDLDPAKLNITIPNFFHLPTRVKELKMAAEKNSMPSRSSRAATELESILEREESYAGITHSLDQGRLPYRVIHYDPKINNVLFDVHTGKAMCVVDLDTCMPGTLLYDFGDMVRTSSVETAEDEEDLSRIEINLEFFENILEGYVGAVRGLLTQSEIALMPFAPAAATLTVGMRVLSDYLSGDVYFKTSHAEHNLQRARAQLALVRSMEEHKREIENLVLNVMQQ